MNTTQDILGLPEIFSAMIADATADFPRGSDEQERAALEKISARLADAFWSRYLDHLPREERQTFLEVTEEGQGALEQWQTHAAQDPLAGERAMKVLEALAKELPTIVREEMSSLVSASHA